MTLFFVVVVVVANLKIGPIITDKLATATMLRVFFFSISTLNAAIQQN